MLRSKGLLIGEAPRVPVGEGSAVGLTYDE